MDDPTFVPDIHISGRLGYYAGHVYSDALVEATDHPPLAQVTGLSQAWIGRLRMKAHSRTDPKA